MAPAPWPPRPGLKAIAVPHEPKPSAKPAGTGRTRLSLRLDLTNGSRLGPGKVALLEAVKSCASISGAARAEGMSYRRAWLLIDDMNRAFEGTVVETFPGRSQGRGARVTELGERLIALYRSAERKAAEAIAGEVADAERASNRAYANPRVSSRREPSSGDGDDA